MKIPSTVPYRPRTVMGDGNAPDEHGLNAMELEEPEDEQAVGAYSASSVRSVTSISRSITSAGDSCGKFVSTTSFA